METVRVVCAHDCPDMCSLLAEVEDGRVLRVRGDPEQPFTAGFACAKVNRDAELVHSPERITTPLRRTGAKGEGRFAPISLGRGARRDHRALAADHRRVRAAGAARLRLQRASGADEPRPDARPVPRARHQPADRRDGLRHVLRGSLEPDRRAGRRRRPGSGRRQRPDRRLGRRSVATNVHFWAKAEAARRRGVKIVVIDPRKSRTARQADRHLQIRIGTDAALALGVMHILARDGLVDRDYVAAHTTRLRPARSRGAAAVPAGARRRDHRPRRGRYRGFCRMSTAPRSGRSSGSARA